MARAASARRYAQAVFEIAQQSNELRPWLDDLERIADIFGDRDIQSFLENPKIGFDQKQQTLAPHIDGLRPLAQNLAYLLVQKGRVGVAGSLLEEYQRFLDEQEGIAPVEIITAVPLSDQQQQEIAEQLQTLVGKQLRLSVREDPTIIGGLIARIGDQVLDGSSRTRLRSLRENLRMRAN